MTQGGVDFGYGLVERVFASDQVEALTERLRGVARSRAGARHLMALPEVAAVARDSRLVALASEWLGGEAIPFKATLFDKSPAGNWLVTWHQDTALPLRDWREAPGWGPWSVKSGVAYAKAPASALEGVIALRLHLDDCGADNGPLRVLPGTHASGVLDQPSIHRLASTVEPVDCLIRRGGVIAMRPLLVHASTKATGDTPRRVLHIEYARSLHPGPDFELRVA